MVANEARSVAGSGAGKAEKPDKPKSASTVRFVPVRVSQHSQHVAWHGYNTAYVSRAARVRACRFLTAAYVCLLGNVTYFFWTDQLVSPG